MSLNEEATMLKNSIAIIKQQLPKATCKRDVLLLKDKLHTLRLELAMCQAELRNGYSMSNI